LTACCRLSIVAGAKEESYETSFAQSHNRYIIVITIITTVHCHPVKRTDAWPPTINIENINAAERSTTCAAYRR
jgi:hypothetical protein